MIVHEDWNNWLLFFMVLHYFRLTKMRVLTLLPYEAFTNGLPMGFFTSIYFNLKFYLPFCLL